MSQLLVDGVECCYTASEHNCLVHSSMLLLWQPSTYQQKWSHQCFFLWSVFLSQSHIFAIIFIYIWKLCWPGKWLYFISELIFSGRLCPVNWRIVIQEDEILWWKVFGSIWPEIFLQYILIPLSAKISVYKCQSAHSVVWHTSPDHYSKLLPTQFVYAFLIPFLSGFSLNVYMLISHNLHFAYISKYNCVSVPNERQVQYASAPGQSVFFLFWHTVKLSS